MPDQIEIARRGRWRERVNFIDAIAQKRTLQCTADVRFVPIADIAMTYPSSFCTVIVSPISTHIRSSPTSSAPA